MDKLRERRGVSELIGFILILGIVITAYATYLGVFVTQEDRRAEFQHSQLVKDDMRSLRGSIIESASSGSDLSTEFRISPDYPQHPLVLGRWSATSSAIYIDKQAAGVTIENAISINSETDDYLNGSQIQFDTPSVEYRVDYSRYEAGYDVSRLQQTVVFDRQNGQVFTRSEQQIINGNEIFVAASSGTLVKTSSEAQSVSIDITSSSSGSPVPVTGDGGPVNVTIVTNLSAAKVRELIDNGNVNRVKQSSNNEVSILLDGTKIYNLNVGKVSFDDERTTGQTPRYITTNSPTELTLQTGQSKTVTAEVRDRFNNPVSGVRVTASAKDGSVSPGETLSNQIGKVSFVYTAPKNVGDGSDTVTVQVKSKAGNEFLVEFTVTVQNGGGGGNPGGGNPGGGNPGGGNPGGGNQGGGN